jgi:hypothetical protein
MANKLTNLRFTQAPSLVDDPANPHARVMLVKRAVKKEQPSIGMVHVDSPDWRLQDTAHFAAVAKYIRQVGGQYCVFSEADKNLGCHDAKVDAVAQLRAIEANKRRASARIVDVDYLQSKRRSFA